MDGIPGVDDLHRMVLQYPVNLINRDRPGKCKICVPVIRAVEFQFGASCPEMVLDCGKCGAAGRLVPVDGEGAAIPDTVHPAVLGNERPVRADHPGECIHEAGSIPARQYDLNPGTDE